MFTRCSGGEERRRIRREVTAHGGHPDGGAAQRREERCARRAAHEPVPRRERRDLLLDEGVEPRRPPEGHRHVDALVEHGHDDVRRGGVLLKVVKEGSSLGGVMDSWSVNVSLARQYGVCCGQLVVPCGNARVRAAVARTDDVASLVAALSCVSSAEKSGWFSGV